MEFSWADKSGQAGMFVAPISKDWPSYRKPKRETNTAPWFVSISRFQVSAKRGG
jgi:hypothetical protein